MRVRHRHSTKEQGQTCCDLRASAFVVPELIRINLLVSICLEQCVRLLFVRLHDVILRRHLVNLVLHILDGLSFSRTLSAYSIGHIAIRSFLSAVCTFHFASVFLNRIWTSRRLRNVWRRHSRRSLRRWCSLRRRLLGVIGVLRLLTRWCDQICALVFQCVRHFIAHVHIGFWV